MNKLLAVRKEFGEPFVDVVRGFAEMGYSRRMTANVLNFNLSYFRALCTRFDLHRHFKPQGKMRRDCKGGGVGWPKGVPKVSLRGPIEHNGRVWFPGEPTHSYLWEKRRGNVQKKG